MEFSSHRPSRPTTGALASPAAPLERRRAGALRPSDSPAGASGVDGQERLASASVLIVGAGGLGSPAAMYLAAAGVGRIGIADGDRVDLSNLHRQLLHRSERHRIAEDDVSAQRTLARSIHTCASTRSASASRRENALDLVTAYDVVIDGTDNFPTRYLLNDACVMTGRPLVYGSVDRFEGQVSVFATERGPCYRCLFPRPPEPGTVQNCADAGVLGVLPGLIGTLQATETLKLILGLGDPLIGRLLLVDTLSMRFRTIAVERDPDCPACGTREIDRLDRLRGVLCRRIEPTVQATSRCDTRNHSADRSGSRLEPRASRSSSSTSASRTSGRSGDIPTARLIPLATLFAAPPDLDRPTLISSSTAITDRAARRPRSRSSAAGFTAFEISSAASIAGVVRSIRAFVGIDRCRSARSRASLECLRSHVDRRRSTRGCGDGVVARAIHARDERAHDATPAAWPGRHRGRRRRLHARSAGRAGGAAAARRRRHTADAPLSRG